MQKHLKFLILKIQANLLLRRLYHWQLKSEPHVKVFLHLSNTLNRMVASVCFSDPWLWSYGQKRSKFRQATAKKFRNKSSSLRITTLT